MSLSTLETLETILSHTMKLTSIPNLTQHAFTAQILYDQMMALCMRPLELSLLTMTFIPYYVCLADIKSTLWSIAPTVTIHSKS